jgi:hypothetical protein
MKKLHPGNVDMLIGGWIATINFCLVTHQRPLGNDDLSLLIKSVISGGEIGNGLQNPDVELTQLVPSVEDLGYGQIIVEDILGVAGQVFLQRKGGFPDLLVFFEPSLNI